MVWHGMTIERHGTLLLLLLTVFPCRHRDCDCISPRVSLPLPLLVYVTPTPVKNQIQKQFSADPLPSPQKSNSINNCQNGEFRLDVFPGRDVLLRRELDLPNHHTRRSIVGHGCSERNQPTTSLGTIERVAGTEWITDHLEHGGLRRIEWYWWYSTTNCSRTRSSGSRRMQWGCSCSWSSKTCRFSRPLV